MTGDTSNLSALANLQHLNPSRTQVTGDIDGLNVLTNLQHCNLDDAQVTSDFSTLNARASLRHLNLNRGASVDEQYGTAKQGYLKSRGLDPEDAVAWRSPATSSVGAAERTTEPSCQARPLPLAFTNSGAWSAGSPASLPLAPVQLAIQLVANQLPATLTDSLEPPAILDQSDPGLGILLGAQLPNSAGCRLEGTRVGRIN